MSEESHLFLFLHGLWGNPRHMQTIENVVKESLGKKSTETIRTLRPSSYRFWKTYEGIHKCANRVIDDLLYEIETLKENNDCKVVKISIVGYSLGGLIARHVIGDLYAMGFFQEVKPVFFTSVATPHVGSRFCKDRTFDSIANFLGKLLFGDTGFQLFLSDDDLLLLEMADPSKQYYQGLKSFQHRILLANIKNDRSVPFYTSYITEYSPFDCLESIKVEYLADVELARFNKIAVWPKFVDLTRSDEVTLPPKNHNAQEATSFLRSNKFFRFVFFLLAMVFFLPIILPIILTLSLSISAYSILKVKVLKMENIDLHWKEVKDTVYHGGIIDQDHAKQGEKRRFKRDTEAKGGLFKGESSHFTEAVMETLLLGENELRPQSSIINSQKVEEQECLVESQSSEHIISARSSFSLGAFSTREYRIPMDSYDTAIKTNFELMKKLKTSEYPLFSERSKHRFTASQEQIVRNLNSLDWIKVPVYHDEFNAHDAIIARNGQFWYPKGTCTLYLYGALLRVIMDQSREVAGVVE